MSSAWQFVLLAMAAYRTWRLIAVDTITQPLRSWLYQRTIPDEIEEPNYPPDWWEKFLTCPWCAGFWITCAWLALFVVWPHGALIAAAPFAMNLAVGLIARNLDP